MRKAGKSRRRHHRASETGGCARNLRAAGGGSRNSSDSASFVRCLGLFANREKSRALRVCAVFGSRRLSPGCTSLGRARRPAPTGLCWFLALGVLCGGSKLPPYIFVLCELPAPLLTSSVSQAWKSSGLRNPFVRCADISPNRGITCHYVVVWICGAPEIAYAANRITRL